MKARIKHDNDNTENTSDKKSNDKKIDIWEKNKTDFLSSSYSDSELLNKFNEMLGDKDFVEYLIKKTSMTEDKAKVLRNKICMGDSKKISIDILESVLDSIITENSNELNRTVCSFVNNPKFIESARFKKYVENAEKNAIDFINKYFHNTDEDGYIVKEDNLEHFMLILIFNNIKRKNVKMGFVKSISKFEAAIADHYDGIVNEGHEYTYRGFWDILELNNGIMSEDNQIDIVSLASILATKKSDKRSDKGKVFKEIYKKTLSDVCAEFIKRNEIVNDKVTENNYFQLVPLKEDRDIIFLIKRMYEYLYTEFMNGIMCIWYFGKDKESVALSSRILELMAEIDKLKKKNVDTEETYEKIINNKDDVIRKLKEKRDLAKDEGLRKGEEAVYEMQKQLKREKARYDELQEKYERLLEFTKELEAEEPETEVFTTEDIKLLSKSFEDKRLVFVRSKNCECYLIMQKIMNYFPNAKMITSGSNINPKATDLVVILTKYISHGEYWKARDFSKAAGVPCIHCDKSSLEGVIKCIAEVFEKK